MKTIKIVIALLIFACTLSFAQNPFSSTSFSQEISLREGNNSVKLEKDKGSLSILVRDNKIFSLVYQNVSGKANRFKPTDNIESLSDCPNGNLCWEDYDQTMSICICKDQPTSLKSAKLSCRKMGND
ncbi:hypothetical protein [Emticicia sp. SJ17W-69]|uniref:hypothetical protein n=1 Tax=Emticicia sp. SJ17W-69 TaxID=3421657 RepID=UPI003EBF8116